MTTGKKISQLPGAAALTGAELVPVVQGGATDQATTYAFAEISNVYKNPLWFGAIGNNTANDTSALQNAGNAVGANGGLVELPASSRFKTTNTLTYALPLSIGGNGLSSAIVPTTALGSTSVIKLAPASYNQTFSQFTLGDFTNGTRHGGPGIEIDATVSSAAGYWLFENIGIFSSGDLAFKFTNDPGVNTNGGLFASQWRGGFYGGGMKFVQAGDSMLFDSIAITGPNNGFEWTGVTGGPSQCVLWNANITSAGVSTLFHAGKFCQVLNCNIEQFAAGNTYLVDFLGNTETLINPAIRNTLVTAGSGIGATAHVHIGAAYGAVIEGNNFLIGSAGSTASAAEIDISASAVSTYVGLNSTNRPNGMIINDAGAGTRGVTQIATKLNSWVDTGGGAAVLSFVMDKDGMVHITGSCKNGTTTANTAIMTLPPFFRPAAIEIRTVACLDNFSWAIPATVSVNPDGNVRIISIPTAGGANAQRIDLGVHFRTTYGPSVVTP